MKNNINQLQGITLLAVSGILCISAGTAHGQRAGRQAGRAAAGRAASSQAATGQAAACPSSSASTMTSTAASTTTSQSTTSKLITQGSTLGTASSAQQASSPVSAQRTASNQLLVQWSGNTSNVQRVYLGVLNANGQVLDQTAVTQMPVRSNFTLTTDARYYGARVVYANGTSRTFYAPIR